MLKKKNTRKHIHIPKKPKQDKRTNKHSYHTKHANKKVTPNG